MSTTVIDNRIDHVGRSGVRAGSDWLVRNNGIRYAGIDRPDGDGGDDGIIAGAETSGTRIENNYIVSAKKPNGRHAVATQRATSTVVTGNVCALEGRIRGGIVLSDRSDRNRVAGNLIVCLQQGDARTSTGIQVFGSNNVFEGNVIVGTEFGCMVGKATSTGNTVRNNLFHVALGATRPVDGAAAIEPFDNDVEVGL